MVSVIISNMNGARYLPKLIGTLFAQRGTQVEIIVVDRESVDGSREILAAFPSIKVVSEPAATGLVSGYHRGVREASSKHLFFCNEDLWLHEDCLAALESHISLENKVAAADPWQWTYDGALWIHGGTRFRKALWAVNGIHPSREYDFKVDLAEGEVVPFPCAGAFLMHRDVYEEVGGWDTTLFLDHEDIDLFIRAWQRGWKCVTVPRAKVYHAVGISGSQQGVSKRRLISNKMTRTVIPLKYFSSTSRWIGWANYVAGVAANLRHMNLKLLAWDVLVLKDILCRSATTSAMRRRNQKWNRRSPGERFFTAPAFQLSSVISAHQS